MTQHPFPAAWLKDQLQALRAWQQGGKLDAQDVANCEEVLQWCLLNVESRPVVLRCDMAGDCTDPITHIDSAGYIYCTDHGLARRLHEPCRKLRPHELKRLQRGEQIKRY